MGKITIRFQFFGGPGLCHIVCLDGEDVATLTNGRPDNVPLLALVMKYKDKEKAPAPVVGALRRYKENWGKHFYPKLPAAPLPHEQIRISSYCMETGWDYVVIEVTATFPDGTRWKRTLRSPHYSEKEWGIVQHCMKVQWIDEAMFSRLTRIVRKEKGPLEIRMTPYNHWGWRGKSA